MIGALLGDIIGSSFEYDGMKTKEFPFFAYGSAITDDSILTMAVFCALEKCNNNYSLLSKVTANEFMRWFYKYREPLGGYGASFQEWAEISLYLKNPEPPYNSFGNGSAMRVSPVAYFASSLDECINLSHMVTQITHNHPEGIKGAEATAVATYMALNGSSKQEIKSYMEEYYYNPGMCFDNLREIYKFDATCQGTVPACLQAFYEAQSYEDAIRIVISLGGDADTMGAITGAIAGAYFGIPDDLIERITDYLDDNCLEVFLRMKKKMSDLENK